LEEEEAEAYEKVEDVAGNHQYSYSRYSYPRSGYETSRLASPSATDLDVSSFSLLHSVDNLKTNIRVCLKK